MQDKNKTNKKAYVERIKELIKEYEEEEWQPEYLEQEE